MLDLLQSFSNIEFGALIGGTIVVLCWVQTQILSPRTY